MILRMSEGCQAEYLLEIDSLLEFYLNMMNMNFTPLLGPELEFLFGNVHICRYVHNIFR